MACKICGGAVKVAFVHTVLGRYSASYLYCDACGFLQTEEPYWLDEAYASAIAASDTGLVQRNIALSKVVAVLISFLFDPRGRYLDSAGGYGMLTRLMRDLGFDFYWSDRYSKNLLARGFEAPTDASFSAVTAFEVFEHLVDPIAFVEETMLQANAHTMIFSTELFSGTPPAPDSWWYYAFGTGQHISFYQRRTLDAIANKLGLHCYSSGSVHLMTKQKINGLVYSFLTQSLVSRVLCLAIKRVLRSKTMEDHIKLMRRT